MHMRRDHCILQELGYTTSTTLQNNRFFVSKSTGNATPSFDPNKYSPEPAQPTSASLI
jgi:hypothetical protein